MSQERSYLFELELYLYESSSYVFEPVLYLYELNTKVKDGRLTDSHGRTVSFKDTIVVMTTNAKPLENFFKPEFMNRFDRVVQFESLAKEDLKEITKLMLEEAKSRELR